MTQLTDKLTNRPSPRNPKRFLRWLVGLDPVTPVLDPDDLQDHRGQRRGDSDAPEDEHLYR